MHFSFVLPFHTQHVKQFCLCLYRFRQIFFINIDEQLQVYLFMSTRTLAQCWLERFSILQRIVGWFLFTHLFGWKRIHWDQKNAPVTDFSANADILTTNPTFSDLLLCYLIRFGIIRLALLSMCVCGVCGCPLVMICLSRFHIFKHFWIHGKCFQSEISSPNQPHKHSFRFPTRLKRPNANMFWNLLPVLFFHQPR